eukprot:comp9304_c0_seq1/m.4396 comp9304_c0_seq1/g.4396  ORF comp9304_c0_seq1/g.4396 comp9304_c0_seq1/m.4396 type:complete len:140 (-) comp9304_c0_seq1:306-725(-)
MHFSTLAFIAAVATVAVANEIVEPVEAIPTATFSPVPEPTGNGAATGSASPANPTAVPAVVDQKNAAAGGSGSNVVAIGAGIGASAAVVGVVAGVLAYKHYANRPGPEVQNAFMTASEIQTNVGFVPATQSYINPLNAA